MSENINTFHGTVGREIRINHSRNGVAVVNFSIARVCLTIGVSALLISRSRLPASDHRT